MCSSRYGNRSSGSEVVPLLKLYKRANTAEARSFIFCTGKKMYVYQHSDAICELKGLSTKLPDKI